MISRRTFLLTTAVASVVAAGGVYVARPYMRKLVVPQLDITFPLGLLQDLEMHTVIALGEVLAPEEYVPPANFYSEKINSITQKQPGFLKEYQRAVVLLNTTTTAHFGRGTARRFEELHRVERDEVLRKLLWQYRGDDLIRQKVEKITASQDALALRIYVMGPLIEHYYRSPHGWAVLGYESFPGQPHDPRAYTLPPGDARNAT